MEYQEIIAAIRSSRDLGLTDDIIRRNLINNKFDEEEINKAFISMPMQEVAETPENAPQFASLPIQTPPSTVQINPPPVISQPAAAGMSISIAFANLVQIYLYLSLYLFSISAAGILFYDIGKWFPNAQYPYLTTLTSFISYWQASLLRGEAAMLLVSLVVLSYSLLWNNMHPEVLPIVRHTLATRVVLYLTFVIYGSSVMISVIFFLFNIFSQTISINIFGQVFIIIAISFAVLRFCFRQLK